MTEARIPTVTRRRHEPGVTRQVAQPEAELQHGSHMTAAKQELGGVQGRKEKEDLQHRVTSALPIWGQNVKKDQAYKTVQQGTNPVGHSTSSGG
ncbi:hypothetical protein GN956_G4757 [Arapaima gigas]